MPDYILGIDPGKTGALALMNLETKKIELCIDVPIVVVDKSRIFYSNKANNSTYEKVDVAKLREIFTPYIDSIVVSCIELVSDRTGQGTTSIFSFGENFGALQAFVESLGVKVLYVPPGNWQSYFGLKLKSGTSAGLPLTKSQVKKEKKAMNARYAQRIHPEVTYTGPRGGIKDGRADAVLITEFLRHHLPMLNLKKAS